MFWEADCSIKQNDASEGKNMQISAKIHQKYANFCQNSPTVCKIVQKQAFFFAYKTLVLLKRIAKIDVSTYESVQ